jgi:aminoglycoside phosphotransferase (APT) family kinase protein
MRLTEGREADMTCSSTVSCARSRATASISAASSVVERDAWVMATTPRPIIDSVVRSVCGREVERVVRLTSGGVNETYRVELPNDVAVVVRIARQPVPWFTDEEHVMAQARGVGVPTAEVLGVEQVDHDGELLSFSIQRLVPGRSLDELAGELPASDLERLVMDGGELLARVHSVVPDRGIRHELQPPDERFVARVARVVDQALGPAAAAVVERGADLLREEVLTRPAPRLSLAHSDWLPKHLLIDDGAIVGVIDWERAGPASPAFDLARWEVSAGDRLHDRSDLLRRGYARVADPDSADAGWVPAFAIDWALEVLGWKNPAPPARLRRCVDVVARYADA